MTQTDPDPVPPFDPDLAPEDAPDGLPQGADGEPVNPDPEDE